MAKINRFYLFIAALVMSKTYSASAATKLPLDTCYDIRSCCAPWFQKAKDEGLNPDDTEIQDPMMQECCESRYSTGTSSYSSCVNVCNNAKSSTLSSTYCNSSSSGSSGGDEPSYIPPSCISGQYWDLWGAPGLGANGGAGSCTTCPTYNYASGKYFSDLASSSGRNDDTAAAGSGGNVQFCYVPRGNVFTDNSGTFQYVNDCYYYGS